LPNLHGHVQFVLPPIGTVGSGLACYRDMSDYYTPLGCFAKTHEWLNLGNFNQFFMIKETWARFLVFF
jgi:hypothetical protein